MDEALKCECGCRDFWFFGTYTRCQGCLMEYKMTGPKGRREVWKRRFNFERHAYTKNWEHVDGQWNEPLPAVRGK
jgi:hypothetical protein